MSEAEIENQDEEQEETPVAVPDPIVTFEIKAFPGHPFKNEFNGDVICRIPKSKALDFFNDTMRQMQAQIGAIMAPPMKKVMRKIEMEVTDSGEVKVTKK